MIQQVSLLEQRIAELEKQVQHYQQEIAYLNEHQDSQEDVCVCPEKEVYHHLVEHSLQGITIWQDNHFVFVNDTFSRITGYTIDTITNLSTNEIHDKIFPEDHERVWNIIQNRLAGKGVQNSYEFRLICKDGSICWVEVHSTLGAYRGRSAIYTVYLDITQRKHTEEAYHAVVQHSLQGLALIQKGRFVFVNEPMSDITGYSVAEMLAFSPEDIRAITHPDDWTVVYKAMQERLDGRREDERYEFRFIRKDNQIRRVEVKAVQVAYQGEVALQGSFFDITERYHAEQALRESESRHRIISETTTDYVYSACEYPDGRMEVVWISGAFEHITGYHSDTFHIAEQWKSIVFSEDLPSQEEIAQKRNSELPFVLEYRILTRQGKIRWLRDYIRGVSYPNDACQQIVQMYGAVQDITLQKEIEQSLRTSEERFRLLAQNARDIVFRYRHKPSPCFEFISPVVQEILGYAPEEYYADPSIMWKSAYPEDRIDIQEFMRTPPATPKSTSILRHRSKEGHEVWLETSMYIVTNEMGLVVAIEGISRDITERKQMEAELQHARMIAEVSTRAKSMFLANMSHELRTPLNAIIGMTTLLLSTTLLKEQQEYAETIRISGDLLLALINDILDLSKIEAGKIELEHRHFSLRDCVEESLELLAPKAAEKDIELSYTYDIQVPEIIQGDSTRLRQILVNLISNATKFTEQGEVVVSVSVDSKIQYARKEAYRNTHTLEPYIHLSVKDTGIGIAPHHIERLFKPFRQADSGTSRKYGGTGLGLTISKRLTEMMGGTISVESQEGLGSTFHVILPMKGTTHDEKGNPSQYEPCFEDRHVLIVSGNATNRQNLAAYTRIWEMQPHICLSVHEVLHILVANPQRFDVAIVDMRLPDMDCEDCLKFVDQIQNIAPTLPILLLGTAKQQSAAHTVTSSSVRFVSKPIRPKLLHHCLKNLLYHTTDETPPQSVAFQLDTQMGIQHPLNILVAEDNVINQQVIRGLLAKLGYRADIASTGNEVLDALKRVQFDLVLMDVQMPEMDGIEATWRIRQRWKGKQQPYIIALTAHAMEGDREQCIVAGMDDYLAKPIRIEQLIEKLRSVACHDTSIAQEFVQETYSYTHHSATDKAAIATQKAYILQEGQEIPLDLDMYYSITTVLGKNATLLVDMFLEQVPESLASIRQAMERHDAPTIYQITHALKSSSGQLGASHMASLLKQLETSAKSGDLEEAPVTLCQIEREFERVEAFLKAQRFA